jgi:alkylation response protein AidB-like acyl-CoA dehydrogenase
MPSREKEQESAQSRALAEQARQKTWTGQSFLRELFLGSLKPALLLAAEDPTEPPVRPEFAEFYDRLRAFLRLEVDPASIDAIGEYPPHVLDGLTQLGAFGMKIPREYGGLGFSHREYVHVMQLIGSYDANVTALLSAHQAIGVPHPVEMFGSETLKRKYLPACARGAISAFALTEPAVGSDPAKLATLARPSADGSHFVLDGQKLWCTNGTLAHASWCSRVTLTRRPSAASWWRRAGPAYVSSDAAISWAYAHWATASSVSMEYVCRARTWSGRKAPAYGSRWRR